MTDKLRDAAQQDIRCECCGYMTHHREHLGCIRAAALAQQDAQAVVRGWIPPSGLKIADIGFRWDSDALQHVPHVLVEFEPVPANLPNTEKGWADRDAFVEMLNAAPTPPAQQGYTAADMADQGASQFRAGRDAAQSEIAELEQENRLMRARNERLDAELKAAKEAEQDAVATMQALGVERAALLDAARQFYNMTLADSTVKISTNTPEKRDAITAAGQKLRSAIEACNAGVQAAGGDLETFIREDAERARRAREARVDAGEHPGFLTGTGAAGGMTLAGIPVVVDTSLAPGAMVVRGPDGDVLLALQNAHLDVQHLPSDDTEGGAL